MRDDKKEYHRIQYQCKMALRIINGTFSEFSVQQYGTSGFNLEDDNEMTTIECWHRAKDDNQKKQIERDLNLPFEHGYQEVKTGTIIKNASEINFNESITFYVFRVIVGRSKVVNRSDI